MAERGKPALVGSGGMGRRYLAGLAGPHRSVDRNLELAAVGDRHEWRANNFADEVLSLLGYRRAAVVAIKTMVAAVERLVGGARVTATPAHHLVATSLLDHGLHVSEKPLALTTRGCDRVIATARNGKPRSVVENVRRDPMIRLIIAGLDDGAIGQRQPIIETRVGGRGNLCSAPWRSVKLAGAVAKRVIALVDAHFEVPLAGRLGAIAGIVGIAAGRLDTDQRDLDVRIGSTQPGVA